MRIVARLSAMQHRRPYPCERRKQGLLDFNEEGCPQLVRELPRKQPWLKPHGSPSLSPSAKI